MADNGKISVKKAKKRLSDGQPFYAIGNTFILKGTNMKNYDRKQALSIILQATKEYDDLLNDKHFLVVYRKDSQILTCCVGFRSFNFLHLTGIKTKMSASKFYSACLSGVLSTKDIEIDKKGKTQQKIAVLPHLSKLLYNNCMIGDFINSGIAIRADYFVGDTRAVLSVGFRSGQLADIPVSLYNESVKILTHPTCKVLAIFRKHYNMDKFDTCTYLAKDYEINKFSEKIVQQLEDNVVVYQL